MALKDFLKKPPKWWKATSKSSGRISLVPCDLPVVSCRFGPPEMGLKGDLKISGLDEEVVLSRG